MTSDHMAAVSLSEQSRHSLPDGGGDDLKVLVGDDESAIPPRELVRVKIQSSI